MPTSRYLTSLAVLLTAASATLSPDEAPSLGKRSALLESRQTCPTAGWIPACPGFFACVPPGAICCSDNISYAMPPETCPDGTEPVATAVPSPSTSISPPPTTTPPPAATPTVLPYTEFSFTITWYYWYYYLTYIQVDAATVTTSYQITTLTTVSVQATDENQATALLQTLKATLAFPTPTQAVTSLSGAPGPATSAAAAVTSSYSAVPTSATTTTSVGTTSAITSPSSVQFTGAASSLRAGSMVRLVGAEWIMGALVVVPGLLMMWL